MAGRKKKLIPQPFSQVLSGIMKERGLKQADIASLADTSVSTVSDWCNGTNPSEMLRVMALAEGLKVSMGYLLTGTHEKHSSNSEPLAMEIELGGDILLDGVFKVQLKRVEPAKARLKKSKE